LSVMRQKEIFMAKSWEQPTTNIQHPMPNR
jgi:hypothetical protein